MYCSPPVHGAKIVANIVSDPALFNEWKAEMEMMAGRIKNVRQKLHDSLSAKDKSRKDWSFILKQIGMFSFTGLSKTQVISLHKLLHSVQNNFLVCCPFRNESCHLSLSLWDPYSDNQRGSLTLVALPHLFTLKNKKKLPV